MSKQSLKSILNCARVQRYNRGAPLHALTRTAIQRFQGAHLKCLSLYVARGGAMVARQDAVGDCELEAATAP
jgi:hypothetical protein